MTRYNFQFLHRAVCRNDRVKNDISCDVRLLRLVRVGGIDLMNDLPDQNSLRYTDPSWRSSDIHRVGQSERQLQFCVCLGWLAVFDERLEFPLFYGFNRDDA